VRIEQLDEQMRERTVRIAVAESDEGEDDPGMLAVRDLLALVNALARADGHSRSSSDENRLLMLAVTGIVTRPAGD